MVGTDCTEGQSYLASIHGTNGLPDVTDRPALEFGGPAEMTTAGEWPRGR